MHLRNTSPRALRGAALFLLTASVCACGGFASNRVAETGGYAESASVADMSSGAIMTNPSTNGDQHAQLEENDIVDTREDTLATFSLDVDTASYTMMRQDLRAGRLPRPDSVRPEEYINFFRYGDQPAQTEDAPFSVALESAPSRFGAGMGLLRIGVHAAEVNPRPAANLVFLVDVSGSMNSAEKLGLVQYSLTTLVNTLQPDDTVGIVVYAGRVGTVIEPTEVANRGALLQAIASLRAGGSTNGEGGIRAAYDLASQHFREGGINRVLICTDGDFNVGLTGDPLLALIEQYRERDITLTALGFGRGNFNDRDMEQLADRGNGNYAFIDNASEALRVLVRDLPGTLQVVAKDVKVQVEVNRELVKRFRLIGYENRVLAHQDFSDDSVDAAEIGSGQFTTAYLEYELHDGVAAADPRQLVEVRVRYKEPDGDESTLLTFEHGLSDSKASFEAASDVFRFGAAVAEFAEILRGGQHVEQADLDGVHDVAARAAFSQGVDTHEFLELVERARDLR